MAFLQSTYFEIFNLPQDFVVNQVDLEKAYHIIQANIHPDRFASDGAFQKRLATQRSTRVNEAYQTLKDPIKRAIYLLQLKGIEFEQEQQGQGLSPLFLMQQIEWRERIEAAAQAHDNHALNALLFELQNGQTERFDEFVEHLKKEEHEPAANSVRELMFLRRLVQQVKLMLHRIEI